MSKLKKALAWGIIWTGRLLAVALCLVLLLVLAAFAYVVIQDFQRMALVFGAIALIAVVVLAGVAAHEWAHRVLGRSWP